MTTMNNSNNFYLNGAWIMPHGKTQMAVINPATEQCIDHITLGDETDVNLAVEAANQAFESYADYSVEQRVQLLQAILAGLKARSQELAQAMTLEMGAPCTFSIEQQVASGIEHCEVMIDCLQSFEFSEQRQNGLVRLEPIGVCGLITPWNWPLNQIACKVFPALAAGCTMVLKPSEIAPLSAICFAEILHQAKVPAGVFNLVHGTGEVVGNALSSHPDVHMMSITGSTRAGIAVAKASADTVKRVHQELGGNCPNLILSDAPLEKAVTDGLLSVFSNSGQTCDSPQRMLVPEDQLEQAIDIAQRVAASIRIGSVDDPTTDLGPLVSLQHWQKVQSLIQLALDEGATAVAGGLGKPEHCPVGYYCKPTVIANIPEHATITQQEIFGPVVLLIGYKDEAHGIAMANDTVYGLGAHIQSSDLAKAQTIATKLRAGTVQINYPEYNLRVPFGGFKQSGNGREYADFGLHDYLEYKSIIS